MPRTGMLIALVLVAGGTRQAFAQNVTVQLPTFQVFSVATTVVVPDRGSTYLGGVNRAAYGSTTRGVPGLSHIPGLGRLVTNRGIGAEVSSSSAHASATILDLEAMDRAVLAEAAARRGHVAAAGESATDPEVARKAAFLSKHMAKNPSGRLAPAPSPPRPQR